MAGIRAFQAEGLPLSLSAVVHRSTLAALPYTCQIADVLDAGNVKLIMPLRKGSNALNLAEDRLFLWTYQRYGNGSSFSVVVSRVAAAPEEGAGIPDCGSSG